MKNLKRTIILISVITLTAFSAACAKTGPAPATLTISAAASLQNAMEEIKTAYAKENPNVTITYNFGSSGLLQKQIEQGAEVDLFISAATSQMDALKDKDLILEDTRKNLLGNTLVLVITRDSSAVSGFNDLTSDKIKKIAIGEPGTVPAGQYAEEVFTKLNMLNALKPKIVYGKDVEEVLTWVESGNADAGVVYGTDAKASEKVKTAAIASEDSHSPIIYPSAVLKTSKNLNAAKDFINYLYSGKPKQIFEKYGFTYIAK